MLLRTALMLCGVGMFACAPGVKSDYTPSAGAPTITLTTAASATPAGVSDSRADQVATDLVKDRHAREITLRIRNTECDAIGVGSAVAISPRLLITNRHVVDGAQQLEVDTWDGRALRVHAVQEAFDEDLGLVRVDEDLPGVAEIGQDAVPGDAVSAVGFPDAGPFQRLDGKVVDYVDGSVFGEASRVMRVTIPVQHGNSGGAVLNADGKMVGIIFAIERATGYGLAIPGSALSDVIRRADFSDAVPHC